MHVNKGWLVSIVSNSVLGLITAVCPVSLLNSSDYFPVSGSCASVRVCGVSWSECRCVSVGSLVKIKLNEPAESGLGLRAGRDGCLRASCVFERASVAL